ncbi:tyrosine kinase, putative [Entamoeba histolytica HM-1:IMSS-B]|uniref:Tyrosine kinase, putative n=4 Tax=Entamoeba histolytica TaxID=5759 RepID=C4LVR6_ENTH1|nr:tyrosine kinase, putative [Entamoeba histolytica HM-1:IMSS]EAL51036.1 tyrosine kinase, putative [Entamoeba histolytica HM-1:IMSS]EMH77504.1 tyrosine kinase, putative [Entamoeba histolytica HM-1:IMSS-B]ENY64269.1 serine-threonine protein kinase, putative [Entamoeba histolytica HM-1:IMSS-A]GAT92771.1 tyrosine kinase putative [Entamoeba histolytica]|eukprot:XP_656422.1 tyrosine kinase, putative [Entamoeba histolytica HM-1:IMSS]
MLLHLVVILSVAYGKLTDLVLPEKEGKTQMFQIHYNEITTMRYNLFLYYKNSGLSYNSTLKQYRMDTYLGEKVNSSTIFTIKDEKNFRPQAFCNRDIIMVLNEGTFNSIEPQMGSIYKITPNFSDVNSPMAFQKRDYPEVKDKEFILVCKDNYLGVYSGSAFGEKAQENKTECGEYITAGDKYVFVKKGKSVSLIELDQYGRAGKIKDIKFSTNLTQSETFEYDPIIANQHNTLYVQVSDQNLMVVFDKNTDYEKEATISLPFYGLNKTTIYNPRNANNLAVYGSMIMIGVWTSGNGKGSAYIYFDNLLSGYSPRFELLESYEGKAVGDFVGFAVGLNHKRFYVGGVITFNSQTNEPDWFEVIKNSKKIIDSCDDRTCECIHDYYYDPTNKVCVKKFFKSKAGIILGCVIGVVLLLIIIAIIIVFCIWFFKKPVEDKPQTYRLDGSEVDFTFNENFPFKFGSEELRFGSEKAPVEINKPLQEKIVITNPSKKSLKYKVEAPETHRMKVTVYHGEGELEKGFGVTLTIEVIMLCTCRTDEYLTISAIDSKGETLYARIPINIESVVSPYIDYTEVQCDILIGEGTFGGVFKGVYRGQTVAIKESKTTLTEKDKEQFEQEVSTYSTIRNEYIVQFIGSSNVPGHTMMVMEYAPFGSVKKAYIKDEFTQLLAIKVLSDCAKGMRFLHANSIIHRDLKPDNLLLFSFSPKVQFAAKISDFGTSKNILSIKQSASMTKAVGTPAYMAPEMINGSDYGTPVDVFSFAVVAFELLSKSMPYSNQDLFQHNWDIADFINSGKRLAIPSSVPKEMADLITNCWNQDPSARWTFQQIDEFLDEYFKEQFARRKSVKDVSLNLEDNISHQQSTSTEDGILKDTVEENPMTSTNIVSLLDQDIF